MWHVLQRFCETNHAVAAVVLATLVPLEVFAARAAVAAVVLAILVPLEVFAALSADMVGAAQHCPKRSLELACRKGIPFILLCEPYYLSRSSS